MNENAAASTLPAAEPLSYFDTDLAGLDVVLDPEGLRPLLQESLAGDGSIRILGIQLLKHRRGRRCSLAVEFEEEGRRRRLFVKLFRRARAARIERATRQLRKALGKTDSTRVPRPLKSVGSPSLLVTEFVEGAAVAPYLYSLRPAVTAARVARSLADLHSSGVTLPRTWEVTDELATTRRWASRMPRGLAQRAEQLISALETVAPKNVTPVTIHRDFYPEQLLTSGRHCYLLDLDDARMGDGAVDAGNFLAHLRLRSFEDRRRRGACVKAASSFRRAYLEAHGDDESLPARVQFYEVASLLRLAGVYSTRGPQTAHLPMVLLNVARARLQVLIG